MSPDEREGAFKGVSCGKCGLVLETSSKAEMHRLKDHTPKGVQDFFRSINNADALRRGEIKSIGYGTIIHKGYVKHTLKFDDDDLIFCDDWEDL